MSAAKPERVRSKSGHRLAPLFNFQSIAVVGASESSGYGSGPYQALRALGYTGSYFPVNPRREQVHGVKAYPSPADLPSDVEAAVIVVGRDLVLDAVEQCARRGAKAIVVVTAGFVEADEHGRKLQTELARLAGERDLLLLGPNCFGVASVVNRCAGFTGSLNDTRPGNVGVVSNSGGLLNEITSYGSGRGMGFSHLASTGNEAVVTAADVLDYYVQDASTEVIFAILETVRDPTLFIRAAERAAAARKPIVALKLGSSEKAARSALTHTGALSGSDAVVEALFRQKGIVRVRDLDELIEVGALFAGAISVVRAGPMRGAAAIEISGGGTALICDAAAEAGVPLPDLTAAAAEALQPVLPVNVTASNPLDTGLSWDTPTMDHVYPLALRILAEEPECDVILSRYTVPRTAGLGPLRQRLDELKSAAAEYPNRLFAVLSRTSDQFSEEWAAILRDERIVFLQGYGRGLRALGKVAAYTRFLERHATTEAQSRPRIEQASPLSLPDREALNEVEAKDALRGAGLPVIPTTWAATEDEAVKAADAQGYPVAAKVISPQVLHKSDVGGVRLGLPDATALRRAFGELRAVVDGIPDAEFQGVAVQPMAAPGLELVLGTHRDPQFGPVVLFGLGGIFVEVLRDVSLRVAPLTRADAEDMLGEIRGRALLQGARGVEPVDRTAIVDALLRLSDLMMAEPRIDSIDLNPVFAYARGVLAVDARVLLRQTSPPGPRGAGPAPR